MYDLELTSGGSMPRGFADVAGITAHTLFCVQHMNGVRLG